ncbi:hypothetical protein IVG45_03260 [Methylomonas sp. LL1]|uniref:hypothetical protein n=1 Tax=Methylomonas sp. LL1 TaxID=2785785 RepID=UPI0018C44748|nr:hypothetical protein [Methylomonas sp. LL1]QPK64010.1 hypothetical protein IVG45_03260 [Methylomonas sp. LL1]
MTGRLKTADELKQAVILRDGGYSIAAISTKTGISASTLSRHFKKHRAAKGALTGEAIEQARQELLNDAGFINDIKRQIAAVIVDDLAHFARLREAMALTLEGLMTDSTLPAHYKTRGLAALATTLRLTQEAARKALAIDDQPIDQDAIPVLTISELTAEEIEEMHQQQREMVQATTISANYDDEVIETFD